MYDLVIIGAGPSGLALAQCCCKLNLKILIIDKENSIGGCHRVRRVYSGELGEYMFTEHGPRIYSETYLTFQNLLKDMNLDFYKLFTKYNFNFTEIGKQTIFSVLSWREISSFILPFLLLIFKPDYGNNIVLYDFIKDFKKESIELINRNCILIDGGDSTKFTLNKFLQIFNQQFFYSLYQPILPNDIGLFKVWEKYLVDNGVVFLLNTNIETVNIEDNRINSITVNNNKIFSKNFVFAIPPKSLNKIINSNNIPHNGNLNEYASDTAYYDYISFSFHWNKILDLKNIYGFPKSDWGIGFIKLTDYMTFKENNSKTVISITLTRSEYISKRLGKSANNSSFTEITNEVYLELKELYGKNFEYPTIALLSPGVIYDNVLKKWISVDTAYINSAMYSSLNFKNEYIDNMYNVGTHNGKSLYKFTSMESAVSNSVYLSKLMYPELKDKIKIKKTITVTDVIFIVIVIIFSIITCYIIVKTFIGYKRTQLTNNLKKLF